LENIPLEFLSYAEPIIPQISKNQFETLSTKYCFNINKKDNNRIKIPVYAYIAT
jgi:hypothetical protein